MRWRVWLADGSTRNSAEHRWADVPHGVLVVVAWDEQGHRWVNWGDGVYGEPGTWKNAAMVADEVFERVLKEAQDAREP